MMFSILICVIQSGSIRDSEEVARMGQTINPKKCQCGESKRMMFILETLTQEGCYY